MFLVTTEEEMINLGRAESWSLPQSKSVLSNAEVREELHKGTSHCHNVSRETFPPLQNRMFHVKHNRQCPDIAPSFQHQNRAYQIDAEMIADLMIILHGPESKLALLANLAAADLLL